MGDLDILRPEVQEAMHRLENYLHITIDGKHFRSEDYDTIRAELLRLAMVETDALIALDCEHDWQVEHERAEKAEAELAALKARIMESPAAVVQSAPGAVKASFLGYGCFEYVAGNLQPKLRGKRARLVVEE